MEQHPIPRDVTGFQFKLIGMMTLKQFGYVAGGALIGYVFFKAPIGILSLPLAGLFWFLGFALAFIPIQERPLDRWLVAFIKSVYSPTQFVWKKVPPEIKILTPVALSKKAKPLPASQYLDSRKKLEKYLSTLPLPLEQELDQRENEVLSRTLAFFKEPPSSPSPILSSSALRSSAEAHSKGSLPKGSVGPPKGPPPQPPAPKKPPLQPISPPPPPKPVVPPPLKIKAKENKK